MQLYSEWIFFLFKLIMELGVNNVHYSLNFFYFFHEKFLNQLIKFLLFLVKLILIFITKFINSIFIFIMIINFNFNKFLLINIELIHDGRVQLTHL